MLQNYLTIAWRNLRKQPGFSAINITGLAVGLTCCLLIGLFVRHELSYDRWNPNAERIVRPVADIRFGGSDMHLAVANANLGPDLARQMPEILAFTRMRQRGTFLVRRANSDQPNQVEGGALMADSSFFTLFPTPVLTGDPNRALVSPDAVALSRTMAEKYFGSVEQAVGQSLQFNNEFTRQVTAVYEDLPSNTHFQPDMLLSLTNDEEVAQSPPYWTTNLNFQTYLLLRPGTDTEAFAEKFQVLVREDLGRATQDLLGVTPEELEAGGSYVRMHLQPLTSIHLYSDLNPELGANGSIQYVWIFSAIGLFILLLACINFMNLATARSAGRAREVGVRKVLGGGRGSLIRQFLSESTLVAAIAVVLALGVTWLVLPAFSELAARDLSLPLTRWWFWLGLLALVIVVGMLAGSYPAFFLSAFHPREVLKGRSGGSRGGALRSALVVFQFTTCVALVIATLLVLRQLNFIQNKKLGFNKEQVIILDNVYTLGDKADVLKQQALQHPAVESATLSDFLPVWSSRTDMTLSKRPGLDADGSINMQLWTVDDDYIQALGMELVAGRDFDPASPADSSAIVLNETSAKVLGFDNPIGERIYMNTNFDGSNPDDPASYQPLEIIGIVKDFHWSSLRDNIGSLGLRLGRSTGLLSVRFQGSEQASVLAALEKSWKELAPGQPFAHRFLDDSFARMYTAEQRIGRIAGIFALLFIFVSCLGLFGLASYTVEQRTREIGIRKVLGASVTGIVGLLSSHFLRLVGLSILLATPLAWYAMQRWLENFAYRISIPWWVFVLAGALTVLLAFVTVSVQSVRAALANPVESLRSE